MIDERIERYDHYLWTPEQLRALRQTGRFVVVRTVFHGGGIRSVHTRLRAALRAAAKVNKGTGPGALRLRVCRGDRSRQLSEAPASVAVGAVSGGAGEVRVGGGEGGWECVGSGDPSR